MANTLQRQPGKLITENFIFEGAVGSLHEPQHPGRDVLSSQDLQLHISQLLQTSLELEKILHLFHSEVQQHLAVDSLGYRNEDNCIVLDYGSSRQHSCHYSLQINSSRLGDLILTRSKPFNGHELTFIEALISSLVCPIRNALLYKEAVSAALKDSLTQIGNRAALETALEREVSLAKRHQHPFSLLVLDIDFFKQINDKYGHSAGDVVIAGLARTLSECCRETDTCYRYGGEEFVLLLNQTNSNGCLQIAERIRSSVAETIFAHEELTMKITVSIGAATLQSQDKTFELFNRADKAMYKAKRQGRNIVVSTES
ncbi:GGDEF domain-containing protein [Dasania marina]|uniref:GGDEF domain-containing protein n=1 Tax=Dasania marina TaxID=471499 RepID=UPI0030DB1419|tara:strand:+ start:10184 stop:11125 length:942 start_codon:yes stop_codon:yes gene_type:complete